MNKKYKYLPFLVLSVLFCTLSCNKIPVGYLQTEEAVFIPDKVEVYRDLDPNDNRVIDNIPWTSLRVQGVSGTNPINYEFHSVKVSDGGDKEAFVKLVKSGEVVVQGGIIRLFQSGVKKLPNGSYTISLNVYNEGYSAVLKDAFTFVVKDNEF
ncbi:MAG: hypothetical protein KGV44_02440 [Flavobacteriaceae bacterium]|nr:hypothetical protein [Flavobacteriaceae bacterium]